MLQSWLEALLNILHAKMLAQSLVNVEHANVAALNFTQDSDMHY